VLSFMDALREAIDAPVVPWDERFTTALAQQALLEGDVKRKARKGAVDKVAAILILQNYLDYRKLADAEGREPAD
jgi:putative Holliday junction resolvase